MKRLVWLCAFAVLLLSCSDDSVTQADNFPVMVESISELSDVDCEKCEINTRVFVRSEDSYYSWNGKKWKVVAEKKSSSSKYLSSSSLNKEPSSSSKKMESSSSEKRSSSSVAASSSSEDETSSSSENVAVESSSSQVLESSSSSLKVSWRNMNQNYSYGELLDERDSTVYRTIQIGDQLWLAENLNYDIPELDDKHDACFTFTDSTYCERYGRHYSWYGAMGITYEECSSDTSCPELYKYPHQGVCPEGWHLPDSLDMNKLLDLFGGMEAAGRTLHVKSFGFNFVAAGYQYKNEKKWSYQNDYAGYTEGYLFYVDEASDGIFFGNAVYYVSTYKQILEKKIMGKMDAMPVRCLKDDPAEISRRNNLLGGE